MKFVDRVRAVVKHIKNSPLRLLAFKEVVETCRIESKSSFSINVPTRWNSTCTMLEIALKFRDVLDKLGLPSIPLESDSDSDSDPDSDCDDNVSSHRDYVPPVELVTPTIRDWKKVEGLVIFLKEFYDLTHRVSGSLYVTSNSIFFEIGHTLNYCRHG